MKTEPLTIDDFITFTNRIGNSFYFKAMQALAQRNYDAYGAYMNAMAVVMGTPIRGYGNASGSSGVFEDGVELLSRQGETSGSAMGEISITEGDSD